MSNVPIPRDVETRAQLMELAGLTAEDRQAIEQCSYHQEHQRAQGILRCEGERR